MENKSHALAAGAFVLGVLALLIALAVWLTRDARELQAYELSSPDPITGLQPQASVRFKGVNVGKVVAIGFDPLTPGNVLIRLAIDEQAPITASTFAALGFQGVTGLAFIQLDDKGESKTRLPTSEAAPARLPMQPSQLSKLSDQGETLLLQLDAASRRINELLAPANQQRLMGAIDGLSQTASQLQEDTSATLKIMKDTSIKVGNSADEARASARAFKALTERMNAPGGTLDQLTQGVDTLAATGKTLNAATLPRLNRALDDTARTVRQAGQAAVTVNDNPQALLFGHGPQLPGPGEAGFSVTPGKP